MKTLKLSQGFTLIELMIVVAIIGTLASIAIPTYQDYVIKTKIIEGLSLVASAKAAVSENVIHGVRFDSGWVAPLPTAIVSTDPQGQSRLSANAGIKIDPTNGVITITYTNKIEPNSPTLLLVPVDGANLLQQGKLIQGGMINWQCHSKNPPLNNIRTDIAGTIDPKFTPADCHS